MQGEYAAGKLDETRQRISDFARSATQHGFDFHNMNGKGRAAHIGPEQPKAMTLISLAVDKDMPELGRMYQRLLSATAHSAVHGLARMLTPLSLNEGRPGEALAAVNIDPRRLAVELVVGPLAAHSIARGVEWFTSCDEQPSRSGEPHAHDLVARWPDQRACGDGITHARKRAILADGPGRRTVGTPASPSRTGS